VNLHPSLLPKYRGAAPVNWAILNGENETGNTVIKLTERMDAGSIIAQEKTPINDEESALDLFKRLSQNGGQLVLKALEMIEADEVHLVEQDEGAVSYAPKLEKKQGEIEWGRPALEIVRKIRGTQPWPGAFTFLEGKMLKILRAKIVKAERGGKPGCVCDERDFIVISGEDAVQVEEVQLEGKKAMSRNEFLRGHKLKKDLILGS
ncbi:MAG: methionyl-tRNA formyltransferase, partial [Candidatus Omnitrophota bacterium]